MPGTIQVSGQVDFPKTEANSSPFSIKIAMGKREYQCMGQSDCSIPVVSLRESLIVVVQNVEGYELFHKEFTTISVVEKGLVEDSYPLTSGGYINIKLQFLLSHEEHIRIHELRESALKRKRKEEPKKTETKGGPVSGQITRNWIAESVTEGVLVDQSRRRDSDSRGPSGTTCLQVSELPSNLSSNRDADQMIKIAPENLMIQSSLDGINKCQISSEMGLPDKSEVSRSSVSGNATELSYSDSAELSCQQSLDFSYKSDVVLITEASQENLMIQSSLDCSKEYQISSEVCSDHKSECSGSSVSGSATEHIYSDSAELKGNQRWSNVKKMVTAFETSTFQEPDPHFGLATKTSRLKFDMESSSKREPSEVNDINKLKFPQTIPKSFSTGLLSDIRSQPGPKFFRSTFIKQQEEIENFGSAKRSDTVGTAKAAMEPKNDLELKSQTAVKTIGVKEKIQTTMAANSIHFSEHVKEGDGPASIVCNKGHVTSLMRDFKASEDISNLPDVSDSGKIFDAQTVVETTNALPSSCSNVLLVVSFKHNPADEEGSNIDNISDGIGILKQSSAHKYTFLDETKELSRVFGMSERINLRGSLSSYQQGSYLGGTTRETESECSESYSEGKVISAISNENADFCAYFDSDECHFGNPDVWNNRHLCVTSGTRQLRDLVDCCKKMENNPSIESGDQNNSHDATSFEVRKNGRSSSMSIKPNHEKSMGISKSNGSFIEQGVRIAIVIVACGTLLFNARQRKCKGKRFFKFRRRD